MVQAKDIFQSIYLSDTYVITGASYDIQKNITHIGVDRKNWIVIGQKIYTDNGEYTVIDINETSLTVIGDASLATQINLSGNQFRHGTVIDLNSELSDSKKFIEKYPLVYLMDRYTETVYGENSKSAFTHKGKYTIYFLTQADFSKWRVLDFDSKTIYQMRNFCFRFIQELEKNTLVYVSSEYSVENITRFAVYYNNKGEEEKYTNEEMSGVRLEIEVSFYKCFKSNCISC